MEIMMQARLFKNSLDAEREENKRVDQERWDAEVRDADSRRDEAVRMQAQRDSQARRDDAARADARRDTENRLRDEKRADENRRDEGKRRDEAQRVDSARDERQSDNSDSYEAADPQRKEWHGQKERRQYAAAPGVNPARESIEFEGYAVRGGREENNSLVVDYVSIADGSWFTDAGEDVIVDIDKNPQSPQRVSRDAMKFAAEKYSETGFFITAFGSTYGSKKEREKAHAQAAVELGVSHLVKNPELQPLLRELEAEHGTVREEPVREPSLDFDIAGLEAMNESARRDVAEEREHLHAALKDEQEFER
jgi:hypothetical protein